MHGVGAAMLLFVGVIYVERKNKAQNIPPCVLPKENYNRVNTIVRSAFRKYPAAGPCAPILKPSLQ